MYVITLPTWWLGQTAFDPRGGSLMLSKPEFWQGVLSFMRDIRYDSRNIGFIRIPLPTTSGTFARLTALNLHQTLKVFTVLFPTL